MKPLLVLAFTCTFLLSLVAAGLNQRLGKVERDLAVYRFVMDAGLILPDGGLNIPQPCPLYANVVDDGTYVVGPAHFICQRLDGGWGPCIVTGDDTKGGGK